MTVPCVRRAWLDLYGDGTATVALENAAGGWWCSSLDLGSPVVREVVNNRPDQNGVDDRTQYLAGRVVSANITAMSLGAGKMDGIASSFAPYMVPSARPVLHYVLDRPGAAERVLTLRASNFAAPIAGAETRAIQLQWLAADPVVRDPTVRTVTAWSGVPGPSGRTYPLVYARLYPAGTGSPTTGTISSPGDFGVRPKLRIWGPISAPRVGFTFTGSPLPAAAIVFGSSFQIDAGHYVDVDMAAKTAYRDGTTNVLSSLDWFATSWPVLPVAPASTQMTLTGQGTTPVSQVIATWQDGYLT
jgi:hypothetical protein